MRLLVSLLFAACVVCAPVLAADEPPVSKAAESPRPAAEPFAASPLFQLLSSSCTNNCDCAPRSTCYNGTCVIAPDFGPQNPNPECNFGCPNHCPPGETCNYQYECIPSGGGGGGGGGGHTQSFTCDDAEGDG